MGCKGVYITGTCYHDEMSLCQMQTCNVNEQISRILSKAGSGNLLCLRAKFNQAIALVYFPSVINQLMFGHELYIYFKMYNFLKIV